MATPTSSSNRSKRKGTKPITQGQNPQRGNRQKVSKAQVTNSSTRGSNAGSAKVTTGRGANAPKPADPWKAPTTKNSRTSAPKSNTTFRTQNTPLTLPNSKAQGTNLPRSGAQQLRANTQGPRPSGKPPVKPSGNFKAPSIPKPTAAAPKPSAAVRIGRGLVGKGSIAAMALGAANAADDARLTPAQLKKKYETVNPDRGQNLLTKFQSGTLGQPNKPKPKQGNAQSRFAGARDRNIQRINNDPRFVAPKPASRPSGSGNTPPRPSSSSGGGGGGGTTPQRTTRTQTPAPRPSTGTTAPQSPSRQTDTNPIGRAQGNPSNFRQDLDTGIQAQKAPDYSKSRTSGTFVSGDNQVYGGTQPSKAPSSNKQRRATGRDEMILENLRRMRRRREQGNNN